jgi:hypothetical protein
MEENITGRNNNESGNVVHLPPIAGLSADKKDGTDVSPKTAAYDSIASSNEKDSRASALGDRSTD